MSTSSHLLVFVFVRQRKEKEDMERKHEKELMAFKKKVESKKQRQHQQRAQQQQQQLKDAFQAQMKKEKLKEQQQQGGGQALASSRQKASTEEAQEPVDHSKSNGCNAELLANANSSNKKSFSGIDKEIEQLAQFESKTKKKPSSSAVQTRQAGQPAAGKMETKLSLNQIKVNQLTNKPAPTVTNPVPARNGTQVVVQTPVPQVPQQAIGTFSGPRNPSFSNLQGPQGAPVPVTNYSGAVINGPWSSGPDNVQWAPNMEEHQWTSVAEPQPAWPTVPVTVTSGSNSTGQYVVRIPQQPFVPAANVAGQPFVVQAAPHQQLPHR